MGEIVMSTFRRGFSYFCGVLLGFSILLGAHAQEADQSSTLLGNIDAQESGLLAEGMEAGAVMGEKAAEAIKEEAARDVGYVIKPSAKPTLVAGGAAASSAASEQAAAVQVTTKLDASLESIKEDIDKLEQEERELN